MKNLIVPVLIFLASCVSHEFPAYVDCNATSLSFAINAVVPVTDCGVEDGAVTLSAKGGKKPYTFSQDGVTWNTDSSFQNLDSRDYTFYLQDANGCKLQLDSVVTRAGQFAGTISVIADSECVDNNGSVSIELEGDTDGFLYRMDEGDFVQTSQFDGLMEGEHTLYVRNANECTTITQVNVPRVSTGTSWMNDIRPIMTASCATQSCHDGISRLDWRNYNQVKLYAQQIKRRTRDGSMPLDKTLPQEQIDKISCWVDDGALNN